MFVAVDRALPVDYSEEMSGVSVTARPTRLPSAAIDAADVPAKIDQPDARVAPDRVVEPAPRRPTAEIPADTKPVPPPPSARPEAGLTSVSQPVDEPPPADNVTPEATELMTRLRVRLSDDRSTLELPGPDLPFFDPLSSFEGRVEGGRLVLDGRVAGTNLAHTRVTIDPATRRLDVEARYGAGDPVHIGLTLQTDVRDLLTLRDGKLAPAPGVEAHTVLPADVPVLANLFGETSVDLRRPATYYATEIDFGSMGHTLGGFAFINTRAAAAEAGGVDPDRLVDAARNNELTHVLVAGAIRSAYRATHPGATGQQELDFLRTVNSGRFLHTIDTGSARVPVARNIQIEELMSDAASIGTDRRDVARVMAFLAAGSSLPADHNYALTVGVMRGEVERVFRARGEDSEARLAELAALPHGEIAAHIRDRWAFTPDELRSIQDAYLRVGRSAARDYFAGIERAAR